MVRIENRAGRATRVSGTATLTSSRRRLVLAALYASSLILVGVSCPRSETTSVPEPPPPEVEVAEPIVREIVEWDEYTGRLAAVERVEVRARVSGYLQSVHFREGQDVAAGDLLYVIDPRSYEAALKIAEAEVNQAKTRLELARNDLDRSRKLLETRAVSAEEFDARSKAVREAEASVEGAEARVEAARLDVEFTEIRSAITGRISSNLVDVGNLISGGSSNSTLLTTIVSTDPIHCDVDVSERAYLKYTRLDESGERESSRYAANPVFLGLADETGYPHRGQMDFVDNRMDEATGTIRGRGIFPNPDGVLIPGLFVRIRLLGRGPIHALQIPDQAIGVDQSRQFVYIVTDENIVEIREIAPGPIIDGLRVVEEGLYPGERVIVNGLQRARQGAAVTPVATEIVPPPRDISLDELPPSLRLPDAPNAQPESAQ